LISGKSQKNQLQLGLFVFLAFLSMATGNVHALQAALLLPLECLGEDCRRAISRSNIPALQGGLLSKNEAASSLFALTGSQTVRTFFKTVKESQPPSLRPPRMS
jgi:hypothetical protein